MTSLIRHPRERGGPGAVERFARALFRWVPAFCLRQCFAAAGMTIQSQSIADSDASMAGDMRSEIRTRIATGESPGHIREWLIGRYGDYISYQPRVTSVTWPLFAIPLALLLIGALVVRRRFGRRA